MDELFHDHAFLVGVVAALVGLDIEIGVERLEQKLVGVGQVGLADAGRFGERGQLSLTDLLRGDVLMRESPSTTSALYSNRSPVFFELRLTSPSTMLSR